MKKLLLTHSQARLRKTPSVGESLLKIPSGAICELLYHDPMVMHKNIQTTWYKVNYRGTLGWSYAGFFDKYEPVLPEDIVDLQGIQTENPYDAKQYIIWDGIKKVNMCGEICVAHILGLPLAEVLSGWERKSPNLVSRIFKGTTDRGTGAHTLINLLDSMGISGGESLNSYFKDELLGRTIFTPQKALTALEAHDIIMGVKIGRSGFVGTGRIAHWVLLREVKMYGKQAICKIFNPYMNRDEIYSWSELVKASANIDGVVVPRLEESETVTSGFIQVEPVAPLPESVVTTTHDGDDYINYDEIDKTRMELLDKEFEPTLEDKLDILWNKHLREIDP